MDIGMIGLILLFIGTSLQVIGALGCLGYFERN
jgi:hypothetical protein